MYQNQYPGIDARVVAIVRQRSQKLIGHYGLRSADLADLQQEWISALVRRPAYAEPTHPDFERRIGHIVRELAADTIRHRRAAKRSGGRVLLSLDHSIGGEDRGPTLGETLGEEAYFDWRGHEEVSTPTQVARTLDTQAFLESLSPPLRALALSLQDHGVEEAARRVGLSRATAFRRLQDLKRAAHRFFGDRADF